MRTDLVRTEMRCRKAKWANRHAGCMTQRRVLREPSQHVTRLAETCKQSIPLTKRIADPDTDFAEYHCDIDVSIIRMRFLILPNTSLLTAPPSFWAAFFLGHRQ